MNGEYHPATIYHKIRRRVLYKLERVWPEFWLSRSVRRGLSPALLGEQRVLERFKCFSDSTPFSCEHLDEYLQTDFVRTQIKEKAERICRHEFNLLGSGWISLGRNINWHRDFVTGFEWDKEQLYKATRHEIPLKSDIKRPWELSRFHQGVGLGLAWRLYRLQKYVDEYVAQVEDWIRNNPAGYGVNWACPMDASVRAVNWLASYSLLHDALDASSLVSFNKKLTQSLWEHGRFIFSHLEWNGPYSKRRANHFLSDLTSLFTLGLFFRDTSSGRRWIKFSQAHLEREIRRQVLKDGVHFECSVGYHRLCLEMFIWCRSLGQKAGFPFSDEYSRRLIKMSSFVESYIRPDGAVPLFGDNDDGRLLTSGLLNINDHRYLQLSDAGKAGVDLYLLMGSTGNEIGAGEKASAFKEGGFYFMRDQDVYLAVRAGRIAHLGAHAHCDQLSFELCLRGEPVFVDRGTFVYTADPAERNAYRGSRAHNVLSINNAEQNYMGPGLFQMQDDTITSVIKNTEKELVARHNGFKALGREDIVHERRFILRPPANAFDLEDRLEGLQSGDCVEWFFHLAPGLNCDLGEQNAMISKGKRQICCMSIPDNMLTQTIRFDHSPSYGRKETASTLIVRRDIVSHQNDLACSFEIRW
jgi:hypothetical protein